MQIELQNIKAATEFIRSQCSKIPDVGIITGTGSGSLIQVLDEVFCSIDYSDIPNFPSSTVKSHPGKLHIGRINRAIIAVLQGRLHYYEGYTMQEVARPTRILKMLGVQTLLMSNAAGGLNDQFRAGDLVFVRDHINLMPANPLRGPNINELGIRFPDMLHTYDNALIEAGIEACSMKAYNHHTGVYCALSGPNLETPAEYQYLKSIGADLVGMSTVPEVIAARHAKMRVCVVSVVSNECYSKEVIQETTIDAVIETVKKSENKIQQVFVHMIHQFNKS